MPSFPKASALQIADATLSLVGRQTVLSRPGCPPLIGITTQFASIATGLFTGAAPCAGQVQLSDLEAET